MGAGSGKRRRDQETIRRGQRSLGADCRCQAFGDAARKRGVVGLKEGPRDVVDWSVCFKSLCNLKLSCLLVT